MTEIVFSFDTEDFTSCKAADGILHEAQILSEEGIKGNFCLVGLLAKQLKSWGRDDVLNALSHHEIGLHTYGHTLHPMINEYTDIADAGAAINEVKRQESQALEYIGQATGVNNVCFAVPPGNQKSYAAMYAYADMGIPIYSDTFCDTSDGAGMYYCNIYHVNYTFCLENICFKAGERELRDMLDSLAKKKRAVIYTHPHNSYFCQAWDVVNYDKTNLCKFGEWKECRRRSPEETEKFFENLRLLLKLIKNDDRFCITTFPKIAERLAERPQRVITLCDIPSIRESLKNNFFPTPAPLSLSIADVFLACHDLLNGKKEHICDKVYGFLDAPATVEFPVTVTADEIQRSVAEINVDGFLPPMITIGEHSIGAADWLFAALDVLCGAKTVTIEPKPQLPSLDILPRVRDCAFRGTWRHSDEFEDKYLSDRLRLQCWTMRF